jgi:excisionase family DNA binding protein
MTKHKRRERRESLREIPHDAASDPEVLYWRITDAARNTGMSPSTIRYLLWKRRLQRYKFGSRTLVSKQEVMGMIRKVS